MVEEHAGDLALLQCHAFKYTEKAMLYMGWFTKLVRAGVGCVYSTYILVTPFRKNFCASRLPKFFYLKPETTPLPGHYIFDRSKKYLLIRKL